ncbi:hypothetical protein L1987_09251 [Smallanthus sonchifolius]|uniref:Uncharacterized protein n=1 Tax=Smallanthus sonchifolius TaxID=185202 RepID=A0ACB9JPS9_9ASTR|nr:hypothetical protein L1987_09251 [Smallanthus sonchifolius]
MCVVVSSVIRAFGDEEGAGNIEQNLNEETLNMAYINTRIKRCHDVRTLEATEPPVIEREEDRPKNSEESESPPRTEVNDELIDMVTQATTNLAMRISSRIQSLRKLRMLVKDKDQGSTGLSGLDSTDSNNGDDDETRVQNTSTVQSSKTVYSTTEGQC